eukprot:m.37628 g.37628  ORF g.37628 m.37628 type:complete len:106 (-) comp11403_c0_seq2:92-409(-)
MPFILLTIRVWCGLLSFSLFLKKRYLKVVDRFNEWFVSAYITPSKTRFLLVHDTKNDDLIKNFFQDAHELYVKLLANPFHQPDASMQSERLDTKVDVLARRLQMR